MKTNVLQNSSMFKVVEEATHTLKDGLIAYFILTYAITWGIGAFAVLLPTQFQDLFGELTASNPIALVAVAAPTIAATLLTLVKEGLPGLRELYSRLTQWRAGIQWYALIFLGIPLIGWLVIQVVKPVPLYDLSSPGLILSALVNLLIFGPLIEEMGWRGYALPRLLKRFNPFTSSLILGVLWGVWHLPSFFISTLVQSSLSLPIFLVMGVCTSILITWIFEHTGGSVLIAVLFHYMLNFNFSIIGAPLTSMAIPILVFAVLVVACDKPLGWFRKVRS
jgi:membrane protease YdiL (CAAX protease family)